ncbi:MAG: hypothetical protein GC138_08755 [Gammaproteobacteria bacterium]|nr:hypothetical protein [Gammaproteobacteria bacterium]
MKILLYALLAVLASISGYFALTNFGRLMERSGNRHSDLERIEPIRAPIEEEPAPAVQPLSNTLGSNSIVSTNASNLVQGFESSAATNITNLAPANSAASTPAPTALPVGSTAKKPAATGRLGLWAALFVFSLVGLGLLIAGDVSHYFGNRALKTLYNEEGEGVANPEYEQAEQVWANGEHLEAISLMREYLKKNPREQYVAIRIAEIYEKDLKNYLAAALEYEEVLKHKLQPDRWGWAAIHLCNLYFKLNQEQKAYPLLRRIANEYPNTPAAEKARKRLEQVEGVSLEQAPMDQPFQVPPQQPSAPGTGLPPGFRPRK